MSKPNRLLLVEDEEADVVYFQRLCRKHGVDAAITVVRDGDAALEVLKHPSVDDAGRFVVVTDLNMPGLTGHELIDEIRGDTSLTANVIFVISTSDLPDDIEKAYARHVAGYIIKDTRGERLDAGVKMLSQYLKSVALP